MSVQGPPPPSVCSRGGLLLPSSGCCKIKITRLYGMECSLLAFLVRYVFALCNIAGSVCLRESRD